MAELDKLEAVRARDEDELRRLRAVNRRWWGASFAFFGLVLVVFFVAGWVFLLWLWSIVEGSPTIS